MEMLADSAATIYVGVVVFLFVLSVAFFIAPLMMWHRLTQLNKKTEETNTSLKYIQQILRSSPDRKCPECGGLIIFGEKKCPLCNAEFE